LARATIGTTLASYQARRRDVIMLRPAVFVFALLGLVASGAGHGAKSVEPEPVKHGHHAPTAAPSHSHAPGHSHSHGDDDDGGEAKSSPRLVPFHDMVFVNAFWCDPSKGEKVTVSYTLKEPARVGIRVLRQGTRELFLANIVSFEHRGAGKHVESWDCTDIWGKGIVFKQTPFYFLKEARSVEPEKKEAPYRGLQYQQDQTQDESEGESDYRGVHDHALHDAKFHNVPRMEILTPAEGQVLKGRVKIRARVDKRRRGYGDKYGHGVRYYVGMCDHNEHTTSQGVDVVLSN
jgi:hypothetical protein